MVHGGSTPPRQLKIAPPLPTPREALEEGFDVLGEAFAEVLGR